VNSEQCKRKSAKERFILLETAFVDIVQKLVNERGKDVFLEIRKIKSLLFDYTKNEFKKEISLLLAIIDTGVVPYINTAENAADCKQSLVKRLEDEHNLSPQKSAEMLDLLFLALRGVKIKASVAIPV